MRLLLELVVLVKAPHPAHKMVDRLLLVVICLPTAAAQEAITVEAAVLAVAGDIHARLMTTCL